MAWGQLSLLPPPRSSAALVYHFWRGLAAGHNSLETTSFVDDASMSVVIRVEYACNVL